MAVTPKTIMEMLTATVAYLLLGSITGIFSGLIGIGGGVFLTPALIYFFGFSQHSAQGTTLALMVPPISLLGAWAYYQQGHVDLKVTIFVCVGFFLGALVGAKVAVGLPEVFLRRVFGTALLIIALKMIFTK